MEQIYLGESPLNSNRAEISGSYQQIDGEDYFCISNYDRMRPFFISLVSHSDHWLYTSSNGGLTAGRRDPENALFPYYTDDKIHDSHNTTGSKTLILLNKSGRQLLWEPFAFDLPGVHHIQRNVYKNVIGNKIIFEEVNHDLNCTFRYGWYFSEQFGFVRKSSIENTGEESCSIELIDGIRNILPYGVDLNMQTERSTLLDAYKKNELLADQGIGLFTLSSIPVDKAEPSESLKCTVVWATGIGGQRLLTSRQLENFIEGRTIENENDVRAQRGAYFIHETITLKGAEQKYWYITADLEQGPVELSNIISLIRDKGDAVSDLIEKNIQLGSRKLAGIVGSSDGLQKAADKTLISRHFSNTLFNVMRGGVFPDQYHISASDFIDFIGTFNKKELEEQGDFLKKLPEKTDVFELGKRVQQARAKHLERLYYEYLPLTFSRRHGDPSRPWNKFSIKTRNADGSQNLYYQGNWRDIFQNWEALALSFPAFIDHMICKFVNASTPDGYNPYRITRDGIDWEVIDPADPWSYIGYWGDHQIIYLLKLLEFSNKVNPGKLENLLSREIFVFANVPYRINDYKNLVRDPFNTVVFNGELEKIIEERVKTVGSDGKLIWTKQNEIYYCNLTEKLLLTVLTKCSNFIPGGGIWLNTQRPEWNDANNALVGNGMSMVTLGYIRSYLTFCIDLFSNSEATSFELSEEIAVLLHDISNTLVRYEFITKETINDCDRKLVMDALGSAGSAYRQKIYSQGFSGSKADVKTQSILHFLKLFREYADHSIAENKREDSLFHAYNLLTISGNESRVDHLYEMLEGQVAVLSSGFLCAEEALNLCKAIRKSKLYRQDQHSYLLYPDRKLPRFMEKNIIDEDEIKKSSLIKMMLQNNDYSLVEKDNYGKYHFNSSFRNAKDLSQVLNDLKTNGYTELVEREKELILKMFEKVFKHKYFTGRSGTFFGYEGLGSIYWHMVSKLLLAVQDSFFAARTKGADVSVLKGLKEHYYDIRSGLGFNKNPKEYGAFPTDPYSHTPANAGAKQPGMTGQVKEDILCRFGELGLGIRDGMINIQPWLLLKNEFLKLPDTFSYFDIEGRELTLNLEAGSLAFTYCQIPFVYHLSKSSSIKINKNGQLTEMEGSIIDSENSALIFRRSGTIKCIEVYLDEELLFLE